MLKKSKYKYKNVYTILEKVKKGELEFDTPYTRFYSGFEYNVKDELIKPYVHYLDERAIRNAVDRYISEPASHAKINDIAQKHKKLISPGTLTTEMRAIYRKFPKELLNDIFNIHHKSIETLKFKDRTPDNIVKYELIEKANNPIAKIITKDNNLNSMIYTRSMVQYYVMMLAILQQEDKAAFDDVMDNLTNTKRSSAFDISTGSSSKQDIDEELDYEDEEEEDKDIIQEPITSTGMEDTSGTETTNASLKKASRHGSGSPGSEGNMKQTERSHLKTLTDRFEQSVTGRKILEEVLDSAKQTTDLLNKTMSEKQITELWEDLGSFRNTESMNAHNRVNREYLKNIEKELRKVSLNMAGIKPKIKSLLDKSISYFSVNEKSYFENIFDAGTLDAIQDLELFHPLLRKISIEDMNVRETQKVGKIDIYIDCSGSMNSSCGVIDDDGQHMSRLLFAKAFAFKMKELNLLNNVYSYQNSVKFEGTEATDIIMMSGGGGTTTWTVIDSIERQKTNAIIITDADDSCSKYSDKAFFIGTKGARFSGFDKRFMENDQVVVFDGVTVNKVDLNGDIIK